MNLCSIIIEFTAEVFSLPVVNSSGVQDSYCTNDSLSLLIGIPSGGSFSGPGVVQEGADFFFVPSTAGSDLTITYTYIDSNNCLSVSIQDIEVVHPLPDLSFIAQRNYCEGEELDTIVGNISGGLFSGSFISEDLNALDSIAVFNPSTLGSYEVSYEYTDSNNCRNVIVEDFRVNAPPVVDLGGDTSLFSGNPIILSNIEESEFFSYLWSTGATTSTLLVENPGFYSLKITNDTSSCMAADTIIVGFANSIWSNENPEPLISLFPNPFRDQITLEIDLLAKGLTLPTRFQILDFKGRVVYSTIIQKKY